jgi:hypothetical protein
MSDAPNVRATRYSLTANVLGAVFGLILLMYLVTLTGLGFSLRERAQQNLELAAERELSAIMTVIQDQVLLRDYPAIEQLIGARVNHEHILLARFTSPAFTFEARSADLAALSGLVRPLAGTPRTACGIRAEAGW